MCIIIHKTLNGILSASDVETAWFGNQDGAGLMVAQDGVVRGYKGFMTFEDLLAGCEALKLYHPKYEMFAGEFVMHLRFATHGLTNAVNTHPFPIAEQYADLRDLYWESSLGLAHNGVMGWIDGIDNKHSDTQHFIKHILAPFVGQEVREELQIVSYIAKVAGWGNKFALMTPNRIYRIGKWCDFQGNYVSNLGIGRFTRAELDYYRAWGTGADFEEDDDKEPPYLKPIDSVMHMPPEPLAQIANNVAKDMRKYRGRGEKITAQRLVEWCYRADDCSLCQYSYLIEDDIHGEMLICMVWEDYVDFYSD